MSEQLSSTTGLAAPEPRVREPRHWTAHGLNTGIIFRATCRGVSALPPPVSHAIGHVGTWLAWRLMPRTRQAVADNLRAVWPGAAARDLRRHALRTLRAYAADVIDFVRALEADDVKAQALFDTRAQDGELFTHLLAQGRGIILVTGHFGNWEIGGVFMRRVFPLPLTVVAMPEASEDVSRTRRTIRDALGIHTIEVRRSLDTALQIRRRLEENGVVAMLMDRHAERDRVEVAFLGRRAWFLRTPALMAYLTGAPLVPCFIERVGRARFRVRPGDPIAVARDLPRDVSIARAAQSFADQLDARIRDNPHQWYQFYPYWDDQPGAASGAAAEARL